MKTFIRTLTLATTCALALNAGPLRAQDDTTAAPPPEDNAVVAPAPGDSSVSFQTFYDQLADQGSWIQTDPYGYVFQPTETNANWAPYTYGHWVNTDAGMTWVSDDSFGWATDHYGRWVNLANYGWVWVPGYTWSPAWVSWRQSDDGEDVGWAPLPPDSDVGIDYDSDAGFDLGGGFGFHIGDDCDVAYGIGPWCYNFCPVAFIGDPDCWHHFRDRHDNFAFIGHTRNITNINFNRDGAGRFGRVHAEGPSVAALNARAHNPIQTARLASASSREASGLRGNTLGVFAPRIDPGTRANARPASVSQHLSKVAVNRGTDVNHPLAVNSHLQPTGATAEQVHAATVAQGGFSSNARIATANTHISHAMTQPLTVMRPDVRAGTQPNARVTGTAAQPARVTEPGATAESRFTGESRHETAAASGASSFTGEPATRHETTPSVAERSFTGEPVTAMHQAPSVQHTPAYSASEAYHPATVYHPSVSPSYYPSATAPVIHHTSTPAYHPQATASVFHQSAPAFHPQASFHSVAPAPHFSGGGGFHGGGAPAAHAGGGGGGGHPSGGGAHASTGKH